MEGSVAGYNLYPHSSMRKPPILYTQIVTNAPYGAFAPTAQYGVGQAHERALEGFWGFLPVRHNIIKQLELTSYWLIVIVIGRR